MSAPMTADSVTAKLQTLKTQVETAKAEKVRAEARMEELQRQEQQILTELSAFGVSPETLDADIDRLQNEVNASLAEAERLLKGA